MKIWLIVILVECALKKIYKNGILHIIMKRGCKKCFHTYLIGTLIFFNEEDTQKFLDKLGEEVIKQLLHVVKICFLLYRLLWFLQFFPHN